MNGMPALTIRNLDDEELRWLRTRAAEHGRSLNAELLDLIAVARGDETARKMTRNPFARTSLRARERGVRTPPTSTAIVRNSRARDR